MGNYWGRTVLRSGICGLRLSDKTDKRHAASTRALNCTSINHEQALHPVTKEVLVFNSSKNAIAR